MASRGGRRTKIGGLDFPEPEEIRLAEASLRKALNNQGVFLRAVASATGIEWRLGPQARLSGAEEGPLTNHLAHVDPWYYWMAAQLKFRQYQGTLRFLSASIKIFRNALPTDEKEPVLRAEWEDRPEPNDRRHAQPHWHCAAKISEIERFHFAMATCWHLGEQPSHYQDPFPRGVADWLYECVNYIRGQLQAIGRR